MATIYLCLLVVIAVTRENKNKDRFKRVGTKAPFNGGFAFAWLSTKLCARV